jgi:hypothetical protein
MVDEDSQAGPESTLPAASYVSKSNSCEHCSADSIVQGRTKAEWGELAVGAPAGRCCLGCHTVMCAKCVDMFRPVLENAFGTDSFSQWPSLDSCPACFTPTLELGGRDFGELRVTLDKEKERGAEPADTTRDGPAAVSNGPAVSDGPAVSPIRAPASKEKIKGKRRKGQIKPRPAQCKALPRQSHLEAAAIAANEGFDGCLMAEHLLLPSCTGDGKLRCGRFLGGTGASHACKTLCVPCYTFW